ncbi:MAG: hypothetical protein U1F81_13480 [Verrucomicrobiaceae bacterium]
MRSPLLVLFLMLPWLQAAQPHCWHLGGTAEPRTLRASGFRLLLGSAEHADGVLKLRAGLQNISPNIARPPLPVQQPFVVLRKASGGSNVPCSEVGMAWIGGGMTMLRPGEALYTTLSFPWPEDGLKDILVLDIGSHAPLKFLLNDTNAFTAPDLSRAEGRVMMLDAALEPLNAGNQHVRLRLGQMRCAEGVLTFEIGFTNIARYSFTMERCPAGTDALMLDADSQPLRMLDVRGGIVQRIAPPGAWAPGEENRGILRFEMPHPHVAAHLLFRFPGYPDLPLKFDEKHSVWEVDVSRKQTPVVTAARLHALAEQKLFEHVSAFWSDVSENVREGRIKEAQARFEMEQRSELFHQIDPLSFDAFEIQPVAEQGLSLENGGLRFVALQLKCRLKGQVGGNGFYVSMLARMDVASDGGWKVKALTFPSGPPFWSRGYNHVLRAQHTIVVHKEGANDLAHARELAGELEQAWTHLSRTGLPLGSTFVGFSCLAQGDFEILSGADPGSATGAVPGVTIEENNRLLTYNLAMYANKAGLQSHRLLSGRASDQQIMVEHELVHLTVGEWSRSWTPGWLVEGIAVYFSSENFAERASEVMQAVRQGMNLTDLTRHGTLRRDNDDLVARFNRYMLSTYAVAWIAKTFGEKKLIDLYRAYADEFPDEWKRSGGGIDYDNEEGPAKQAARLRLTEMLIRKHLGVSLAGIEAQVIGVLGR